MPPQAEQRPESVDAAMQNPLASNLNVASAAFNRSSIMDPQGAMMVQPPVEMDPKRRQMAS